MKTNVRGGMGRLGASLGIALLFSPAARAAINISTDPTQNMNCTAGTCTATAQKAYLNVNDVTNFLAAGDLKVASGAGAEDIHIQAPFSWTSTSRLTLDAQRSIEFEKPVSVAGTGALTLVTNDGDTGGDYWFDEGASVSFFDHKSSLLINGSQFTLVPGLKTLIADIAKHPSRHYALTRDYDATADGTYTANPVPAVFGGIFEGLGHSISNLSVRFETGSPPFGLFSQTGPTGVIRDVSLLKFVFGKPPRARAHAPTSYASGALVGSNYGLIAHAALSGAIYNTGDPLGGITGENFGAITASSFSGTVEFTSKGGGANLGGIAGTNSGKIDRSFAVGLVKADHHASGHYGGVTGTNSGDITASYETAAVVPIGNYWAEPREGGLVGVDLDGNIQSSYAIGFVEGGNGQNVCYGGFLGVRTDSAIVQTSYYQQDGYQGVGCGTEDGVTMLTQSQFQSGLPDGFDLQLWGESPDINNGYPYLLANPPPKNAPGKTRTRTAASDVAHRPPVRISK